MTGTGDRFDASLERALGAAHAALRALEASEPTAATLPAARSVRRAIGALLDAIDQRTSVRSGLDRAVATLTFAFAALGGGAGSGEGGEGGEGAEGAEEEGGDPSPAAAVVASAAEAAREAVRLAPAERLDEPPSRSPDRPRPRWRVTDREPRLVDVPRRSLLPPDAILLAPEPTGGPPAPRHGEPALPGLDERALLAQAAQLGADAALLEASTNALALPTAAFGARPLGDLAVGALLDDAPAPQTEAAFARANAREHFEDLGMFGLQRLPLFGDDFADVEAIELRLLASADALLGDAPSLADLERLARDTPAPDPMRVFAMAFVGGSLEGRDGLAAAERTLYAHDPHDPAIADAFGTALAMTPNPLADRVLTSLARAEEGPVRAAAIRALTRRGPVDVALLVEAGESLDPHVVAAALPALAIARHPHAAALVAQIAARERATEDPALAVALWEALALALLEDAAAAPRARLATGLEGAAAIALAIVADADDAAALLERTRSVPSPALLTALGWAGSLEAAPLLIEALGSEDLAIAAARALERLLGGCGLASVDIDPESLAAMEPLAVRAPGLLPRSSLAAALHALDEEPEASADQLLLPTTDPALWQRRLEDVRGNLPRRGESLRVRRGELYLPGMSLAELGSSGQDLRPSFAERQLLARELAVRTGRPVPFSPEDLVVVQRRNLAECQKALGAPAAAGSFERPVRGGP